MPEQPRKLEASDMWTGGEEGPDGRLCVWGWVNKWWPRQGGDSSARRRFIRAYRQANGSSARTLIAHNDSHCKTHEERAEAMNKALDLMPSMSSAGGWNE
jgi:hypothetical protein